MAEVFGRDGEPVRGGSAGTSGADSTCNPQAARDTRFKKGNRFGKGRPKGAKNLKTMVNLALSQKVPAKIGGKTQTLTKAELAMHQLANKASAGDQKAIDKVIALHERYGPQDDPAGPSPEEIKADIATLRDYLRTYDLFNAPPEEVADG